MVLKSRVIGFSFNALLIYHPGFAKCIAVMYFAMRYFNSFHTYVREILRDKGFINKFTDPNKYDSLDSYIIPQTTITYIIRKTYFLFTYSIIINIFI